MSRTLLLHPLLILPLLLGCAGVNVDRYDVHDEADVVAEREADGVRYYEEAPFLLLYPAPGGYRMELHYLPDTSVIHVARPYELLVPSNSALVFENGVLTGAHSRLPRQALVAAKDALAEGARQAAAATGDQATVRLFRVHGVVEDGQLVRFELVEASHQVAVKAAAKEGE